MNKDYVFDFVIPQGPTGPQEEKGEIGPTGPNYIPAIGYAWNPPPDSSYDFLDNYIPVPLIFKLVWG